jgi:energy-coupling factor transport system ATP-binding protein
MEFVASNFYRIIVMAKKKIVRSGSHKEIFWDFETLEYAMLKQPYVSRVCKILGIEGNIIHIDEAVEGILSR